MRETLDVKEKYGQLIKIVKFSGLLGVDYALEVDGEIKEQSNDLKYISSQFDRY
ncbi:MAG: hypothetical protein Q4A23_02100 [bacterium]|nr:hypothetical protein [bacterium]